MRAWHGRAWKETTGLPAVVANVTNTVAMAPGFVGATLAQRRDLVGQGRRLAWMLPVAGVAGGLLLLHTGEAAFNAIVPCDNAQVGRYPALGANV